MRTMASTLADLLKEPTLEQREGQLLAALNAAGFPVSDWVAGSPGRTIVRMIATGLLDFDALAPAIAAGGFLGPIRANGKVHSNRGWLELLASEIYGITATPATPTKQRIALWCAPGTGPYTIVAGQLTARSSADRRYTNVTSGTVPAGTPAPSEITLDFTAETPGAVYNGDIAGTILELVTPLPGLSVANKNRDFGGLDVNDRATRAGSSTGTVKPDRTDPGVAPASGKRFSLVIIASGQLGVAIASLEVLELDGSGNPVTTTIPLSPLAPVVVVGNGISLAFANGGQNPSFIAGDRYTWETPGSPIINAGVDIESIESIQARCRARWPSLSLVPTEDRYIAWARQASLDNGYGITKIVAEASVVIAGGIDVLVATDVGGVPGAVVTALQAYIDARRGITDVAVVASATPKNVTAGGTVTVRTAEAGAVKAAAKANWEGYLAELPIGGSKPDGVVRLAELQQAIMDAGAVDVAGLTLNGAAANTALEFAHVAVAGNAIDTGLTWNEVL